MVCWDRRLLLLCTLGIGFSKKFHFILMFSAKMLQNSVKLIQKLTPGFKNHTSNLENFRQVVQSPKNWNLTATFVQKIFSFS